uniref:SIS domain-containing protein n=1 Tax=Desulfomonile tiedjei TaxID=2358 RepID=A0A7C4EVY2_9BACT
MWDIFRQSSQVRDAFLAKNADILLEAIKTIATAMGRGNKLLIFGNGGSAADSQHLAAEFVNRYLVERPPLPALALTTDTSILTAIGNDYQFHDVFEKQIKALGKKGDVAFGISTSGRSLNVIKGLKAAQSLGLTTIGLGGPADSPMKEHSRFYLTTEGGATPRIQETHLVVYHCIVEMVDRILFGAPPTL